MPIDLNSKGNSIVHQTVKKLGVSTGDYLEEKIQHYESTETYASKAICRKKSQINFT